MQKLPDIIKNVKYVSFDIFDTLVLRSYSFPKDLFQHMSFILDDPDFARIRIEIENNLRNQAKILNKEEITFDDIYNIINNEKARQLELNLEYANCFQNKEVFKLYKLAIELNKKVLITSDMYLSYVFIKKVLFKIGVTKFDKLFLSSYDLLTKWSGSRYKKMLEYLKCDPKDILHIGDNKHSDFEIPQNFGINSYHYEPPSKKILGIKEINQAILCGICNSNSLLSSIQYSYTSDNAVNFNSKKDYWYRIGFDYAGIILYSFCKFLLNELNEKNIEEIIFLSRDGQIIKKVFDIINDKKVKSYYIYSSRRVLIFPILFTKTKKERIDFLTTGYSLKTPKDYIERLGIDLDLSKELSIFFKNPNSPIECINNFKEKIDNFFYYIDSLIVQEAIKEKEILIDYFKSLNFEKKKNIALCDIGWSGSMQSALQILFKYANFDIKIHGFYLGMDKKGKKINAKGFLFDESFPYPYKNFMNYDIFETLTMSDHLSVLKIEKKDKNIFLPKFCESNDNEVKRIEIAKRIQNGIMDFVKKLAILDNDFKIPLDREYIINLTFEFLSKQTLFDFYNFYEVPHNTDYGNSKYYRNIKLG